MVENKDSGVRIVDFDMPMGSMVWFMVKWAIASIPALLILILLGFAMAAVVGQLGTTILNRNASESPVPTASRALVDSVLRESARPPSRSTPEWSVTEEVNPIDDSPTVVLTLDALSTGGRFASSAPTLILRCKTTQTQLYITWSNYLGSEDVPVTTRLGRAPAVTKAWSVSTDGRASFYPGGPIGYIKQLALADTLVAKTTPYNESPVTAVFIVSGLAEKLLPLKKACGW